MAEIAGWRNSNLFLYGWLPVRFLAASLGLLAGSVVWIAAYLMWLDHEEANRVTKGIF